MEEVVRKFIALSVALVLLLALACGGGGGETQAKGEAKHVAQFLDNIFKKGDLNAAYQMMASEERAMMGMIPGFYDFITGKDNDTMSEEMRLMRVMYEELIPIPENLIKYEIGEPVGEGDTLTVPITFSVPKEDMEDFFKARIDQETFDKMENLDELDAPFEEKTKIIKDAIGQAKSAIEGETFEMETNTNNITLIKKEGEWKISFLQSGLMDNFGGF